MTTLTFDVAFHGPFRIATGQAKPGVDASVDPTAPLPATALKGLARHTATHQLRLPPTLVDVVFGTPATASPWGWSDGEFPTGSLRTAVQAQVRIDPLTGTADTDGRGLMFGEQLWCAPGTNARVDVELLAPLADDQREQHVMTVIGAMCAIHSLGASRRRGLGRVTVRLSAATGPGTSQVNGPDWARVVARLLAQEGAQR